MHWSISWNLKEAYLTEKQRDTNYRFITFQTYNCLCALKKKKICNWDHNLENKHQIVSNKIWTSDWDHKPTNRVSIEVTEQWENSYFPKNWGFFLQTQELLPAGHGKECRFEALQHLIYSSATSIFYIQSLVFTYGSYTCLWSINFVAAKCLRVVYTSLFS